MHNSILIAILLMLVSGMASAQFYTITKEAEIKSIQTIKMINGTDNKEDKEVQQTAEIEKDSVTTLLKDREGRNLFDQKVYDKTSQKSERVKSSSQLPELTIPNLYAEIKRNGILYPKVVLAQAILETGWFCSPLSRDRHNLFGLTNPHTGKYYEFAHWTESVRAYYTMVQYKYKREDGNYLLWLKKIGYAEASDYVPAVISVLKML